MNSRTTRAAAITLVALLAAAAKLGIATYAAESGSDNGAAEVITIVAQRFSYTPSEIVLHKGQAVVLEFHALDFMHGFSVPGLGLRADLIEGQVTRVRLTPEKAGSYDFHCDNFCGAGHEDMNGMIIVKE